ncbi:hypothetical protein N7451_012406 [Penicillium sp. IBT 35674x]|nr:hypothetical protein N7451_012406 [Penicillium sp. IBT 35674x]
MRPVLNGPVRILWQFQPDLKIFFSTYQVTGDMSGEHMFFLPRMETVMGNLRRVRGQMLDIIAQSPAGSRPFRFQLSLWPRMDPLPYSSHSVLSSLATLPTMPILDPSFFVNNMVGNYHSN